jgi:hypothetical protein
MKAIFIAYNQAYGTEIVELLSELGQRGFTQWKDIEGRGGEEGDPHYGNHAWPTQNYAILTIVPDDKAEEFMKALHETDEKYPDLGLRAFQWTVDTMV